MLNKGMGAMKRKCDRLWSNLVLIEAKHTCAICGKSGIRQATGRPYKMEAHHIIGRANRHFRHNPINGICLCVQCHKWNAPGPHATPAQFELWMQANRPEQFAWWMKNRHAVLPRVKIDLAEMERTLKALIAQEGGE